MSTLDDKPANGWGSVMPNVNRANPGRLHVNQLYYRPSWLYAWEDRRPKWLQECCGEALGIFLFTYAGIASTCLFNFGLLSSQASLGSIFSIAFNYAVGIAFAVIICGQATTGHFNPAFTIANVIFRGFPIRKAPYYIFSQLLGSYIAGVVAYGQFRPFILEIEESLIAKGKEALIFTAQGTAGMIASYPPAHIPLKWTFFNEFVADFFIGTVLWGALDPSNVFVTASTIPFVVGFGYFIGIHNAALGSVSTTPARALGGHFAALSIWGREAWAGKIVAIGTFTPILATLAAAFFYELFIADSSRAVTPGWRVILTGKEGHRQMVHDRKVNRANGAEAQLGSLPHLRQVSQDSSDELRKTAV